jgi:alpha-L-fucosidase
MHRLRDWTVIAVAGAAVLSAVPKAAPAPRSAAAVLPITETTQQHDLRLKWWREAKFGMFIHWGVYAVPAGTYQGRPVAGIGEWIMNRGKIPVAEYRRFAQRFDPVKYDPDRWVRLAKEAGMKYIVITSKHHDGFALFDSKVTNWDVVDATPYGKDLLKPLAAACRKHGIKLGFYYSQAQDWNHPGGAASGGHWDPAQDGDMDAYLRNIAVPQVREILTNYGKIAILWFDTPVNMTAARAALFQPLLKLQPGLIVNNRLGGGFRGDTETPEQFIPATGLPGRDWETCMTMNGTWGYKSYDNNWKSPETLIRNLVDIASKGGNYLLNVGPTSEGLIPAPSVERLQEIGKWMKINGEAIYGTAAGPFKRLAWGRCTQKRSGSGTTLYLHVFAWPPDGKLVLPGLRSRIERAYLLADPQRKALSTASEAASATINLPGAAPDAVSTTIALRIDGAPDVEPPVLEPAADGSFQLPASDAVIHGKQLRVETRNRREHLGYWTDVTEWVEWPFAVRQAGRFTVTAEVAAVRESAFEVIIGTHRLRATAPATGDYARFQAIELGEVEIAAPGQTTLSIKPLAAGWQPMNLRWVRLRPVP